jgi:outer membrane protein insertion porin family
MSSATSRGLNFLKWLGSAALVLSFASGPTLWADTAPSESKPSAPPSAPQSAGKPAGEASQEPAEKGREVPQKPRLETPQPEKVETKEPGASASGPQQPGEKAPREAPSQPSRLQLETPKEAPPEAPKAPGQPTAPVEQPKQAVIEDILFRGNRRVPSATLRARVFTRKGDVYDENALERDFMALWNTGFLDDIRCEATDGEKGKIITFYVREKKLVRSIDYKGLSTVMQSDVLDAFKKRKVGLSIQSQYDPVVIKRAQVVLQELLADRGRQFATVRARTRNIPPNSVALTFIVVEGPKVKLGEIRYPGSKVFSTRRLVRAMKYSRPVGAPPWFYWFHKTYAKDRILADLELHIRTLYQDNGYFYVVLKEPVTKMTDTKRRWPFFFFSWGRGKRVDVTIPVEEGPQYKLGRLLIRGNKLFRQEQLQRVLQLKTGDIFNLGKVRKSIENFQKLYGAYGYINFTATPDIEPDNKKHLINLALDFEEEKQYFIHRIEFSGNTKTRDKVVRRELLLDEGNIFSSELWDLSVLRVNQLGFFEQVKKEDYEIRQNRKDATVDVVIKVKEKGRNSIGFSGGVSGLAGNFVGINYATNNFLGLGETLSLQFQWGTYEKLYSFGFTEPYLLDRPITTGFTIFKSDYRYDQLRQAAYSYGIAQSSLASTYGQAFFQNYQQNSSGFTVFASYPLRRTFARMGLTYSYSVTSLQTFSSVSQAYFEALNFRGLEGPSALRGITSSQVMPTYLYNTLNDAINPTSGKYIFAALSFSGSFLGGNVNTIRPVLELKYFHPVGKRGHAVGMRLLASTVSGFGGRVAPPSSRFFLGGEDDIRGFDIRSISPVSFYPTIGTVCNRDSNGNPLWAADSYGRPTSTCGSSTRFPYNAPIFPGGDTSLIANFEYRFPIAGPVTAAYFVDTGSPFILRNSQLRVTSTSLADLHAEFPDFPLPRELRPLAGTNFHPRVSTGIEVQVILPIVNAPFRIFYGYNLVRLNEPVRQPQSLPPRSLFPNDATYTDALRYFQPFRLEERRARVGFTVARTF